MKPDEKVLQQFGLKGEIRFLPGGSDGNTYRVGNVVQKHSGDDLEQANWIAELFASIEENGFRVSRPVSTTNGEWVAQDGWSSWTFLEGSPDYRNCVAESIRTIIAFNTAIRNVPKPGFLLTEDTPYSRADRYAFGEKPKYVQSELKEMVDVYYSLRKPINTEYQLIHGDLNPDNILLSPGQHPAIIDMPPYWRPVEFALAVYAYWIGPWNNNLSALQYFNGIKDFEQMLIRAGIRMLLIRSEFGGVRDDSDHKAAFNLILEWLRKRRS